MTERALRLDDVAFNVFGPAYERKCSDHKTIVCARHECQQLGRCALSDSQPTKGKEDGAGQIQ